MKTTITFSQAVDGFLLAARSRHLSQNTIKDYLNTYRKFLDFLAQDPLFAEITSRYFESFLAAQDVSKKTLLNYHVGLSSMWTWGLKESLVVELLLEKFPVLNRRREPFSHIRRLTSGPCFLLSIAPELTSDQAKKNVITDFSMPTEIGP